MNRRPHFHEPIWRAPRQSASHRPPPALLPWLRDRHSLTRRLMARCGTQFRVEVIQQTRVRPSPGEARAIGLRTGAFALQREVYLCCGRYRWVYARTVIPDTTARGPYRRLRRLGETPLGTFLFALPRLARGPFENTQARLPGMSEAVWGRRSVFHMGGRPLVVVTEFFLPAFASTL